MNLHLDGQASQRLGGRGSVRRVLSLFSGCGGMDLGFEGGFDVHLAALPSAIRNDKDEAWGYAPRTSFEVVFANDIVAEVATMWRTYFDKRSCRANEVYHLGSIVDLVKRHKEVGDVFPQDIDLVIGGFPCQDFSLSGKRLGFQSHRDHRGQLRAESLPSEETRGKLYMWMKEVIEIVRPKMFVAENVKGLVNLEDVRSVIQRDFSSADDDGYFVFTPQVLHAAHYGVPQSRERVIFIGVRKSALRSSVRAMLTSEDIPSIYLPYPERTHRLPTEECDLPDFVSVGAVLSSLDEPAESNDPSQKLYSKAKYMGAHCQGQKEIDLLGLAPTIRSEHHGNIEFRRLSLAHGGKCMSELQRGLQERRLTPRECAMIQTFPRDYDFVLPHPKHQRRYLVSPSAAYRAIGNAVPPLLAYHIAKRLEELWPLYFNE